MPQVLIESKREPGRTKLVSERDAKTLVRIGHWQYATTALEGGRPSGPRFASRLAEQEARARDLGASAFEGRTGTGRGGAFTKPDVQAIAAEATAPDAEPPAAAEPPPEPPAPAKPAGPAEPTQ